MVIVRMPKLFILQQENITHKQYVHVETRPFEQLNRKLVGKITLT
jgi:hypothetical protein